MIERKGLIPDVTNLQDLFTSMQATYTQFHNVIVEITERVRQRYYEKSHLVDLGFLCREIETLCDEWRKDAKVRKELIGKLLALLVIQSAESVNQTAEITVQGALATGTPALKMLAELPKKGTPEYEAVCNFFNLPSNELVKMDWKRLQEELNRRVEEGQPMPPGLGKTYPIYSTLFRRKETV